MGGKAVAQEGDVAEVEPGAIHFVADNFAAGLRVVGEIGCCGGVDTMAVGYECKVFAVVAVGMVGSLTHPGVAVDDMQQIVALAQLGDRGEILVFDTLAEQCVVGYGDGLRLAYAAE